MSEIRFVGLVVHADTIAVEPVGGGARPADLLRSSNENCACRWRVFGARPAISDYAAARATPP